MRKFTLPLMAIGAMLAFGLTASPASAQATRTWVSGVGDDANPCSRTAPCKTFAGAISKTQAGGEINCLDPGGFGGLTITKAITVSCEAGTAGALVSGTNAFIINAPATDAVVLRGLDFEGLGTGINGIRFISGASLLVQDCSIRNFRAVNGLGISFTPSTSATLSVVNTIIENNGNTTSGGGVLVGPTGSATAGAILDRVTLQRNFNGIAAVGIGPAVNVMIFNSTIAGSISTGLIASGAGATLRIGNSAVTTNAVVSSGASVLSYGNNQINGNTTDTIPGLVPGGLH